MPAFLAKGWVYSVRKEKFMASEKKNAVAEAVGGFFKAVGGFLRFWDSSCKRRHFCKIVIAMVGSRLCTL